MRRQWFKVELLSDVVVSVRGATEGAHQTLDYIPGSAFLGMVAGRLEGQFDPDLFWSGRLTFGDALPLLAGGRLAFPMPLSFHLPKGTVPGNGDPPRDGTAGLDVPGVQMTQLKQDYVTAAGELFGVAVVSRMKTAIERGTMGRSADGMLFGYQAIAEGQQFAMRLDALTDVPEETYSSVIDVLRGEGRVGRSRSAEYGRIRVSALDEDPELPVPELKGDRVCFYLLSDLCLNHAGCPRLIPEPGDFGLENGSFNPGASFLKTRAYSPWNNFYNSRLTERQVISRGSVITFTVPPGKDSLKDLAEGLDTGIGDFREEGLGRALVNPAFLFEPPCLNRVDAQEQSLPADPTPIPPGNLARYLQCRRNESFVRLQALEDGRNWASKWFREHRKLLREKGQPPGKSQWGKVRAICLAHADNLAGLRKSIEEFCGKDMRQRFWCSSVRSGPDGEVSMLNLVLDAIKEPDRESLTEKKIEPDLLPLLVSRTIYYASAEMARKIQSGREEKGEER